MGFLLVAGITLGGCGAASSHSVPPAQPPTVPTGIRVTWFPCSPDPPPVPPSGTNPIAIFHEPHSNANYWKLLWRHPIAQGAVERKGGATAIAVDPGWYVVRMGTDNVWLSQVHIVEGRMNLVDFHTGC